MNPLLQATVHELSTKLSQREITSVELTQACLAQIEATNERIGSFLLVDAQGALEQAKKADRLLDDQKAPSPLTGIPIGIKDILCTQGVRTTAASQILKDFIPPYDATIVQKLKNVGSVLIGKTNCDEFAMGSSNENSSFMPCRNPWNIERVPGGSSGGSAACISARQVPLSIGTDTGGSIRQPAALCGITGLKPTYGSVSRYGVMAFASSLDQVGPMGKTVLDNAYLLEAIKGHDPLDSTSRKDLPALDFDALSQSIKGKVIGIPDEVYFEGLNPEIIANFETALDVLKELGATTMAVSMPHSRYATACYYIIAPAEASSNLSRYDGIRYTTRKGQEQGLNEIYRQSRSEGFGPEVQRRIMLGTFMLSAGYYDAYYMHARRVRKLIRQDFDQAFAKVDVIASPTVPGEAFSLDPSGRNPLEMYLADVYTVSTPLSGNPAISIPSGFSKNHLPLGLQLIGNHFDEQKLLQVAHQYEQATQFYQQEPSL